MGEVWVFTELDGDEIAVPSRAALGEGRRLASGLGSDLVALMPGADETDAVPQLARWGVATIYLIQNDGPGTYVPGLYTEAVTSALREGTPLFFLAAATPTGSDLAPRVAARLGTACATNALKLDIDADNALVIERKAYNGRADARVRCAGYPVIVTLQPGVFRNTPVSQPSDPEVIRLPLAEPPNERLVELVCHVPASPHTVELDQADVIVVGGGGVGGPQGFEMLWELAELLGGTLGGTRVATDRGWLPRERQIGQTGVTVSPELMISCGVSGAIQHAIGLRDTGFLVAINRDRRAPIFELSDFGVVGDLHQVVPALIGGLYQKRH
jgi:electron transfer flavoprotein alpha subunit